jgi:ABC-type sugar transport system substrate-binding protein
MGISKWKHANLEAATYTSLALELALGQSVGVGGTAVWVRRTAGSWLRLSTANQEQINAVQAQNDFLALGARRAIEERSTPAARDHNRHFPFLGVDGLPKTGQAWVTQGTLTATIIVPPITAHALDALAAAIRSQRQAPAQTLVAPESFPRLDVLRTKLVR